MMRCSWAGGVRAAPAVERDGILTGMIRPALMLVLVSLGFFAGACASNERGDSPRRGEAPMTFVYLKTGHNSASHTSEQKRVIFKGHMANMQRLVDERSLVIAGPFGSPRDPSWRGIFVMDVPTVEQARQLGETDPGVSSGEFTLDIRPVVASVTLRESIRLNLELQERLKASAPAGSPSDGLPPGLRRYIMMHADDFARARRALRGGGDPGDPGELKVIWSIRFRDGPGGVFVFDATDVDQVESSLRVRDLGPFGLDQWFSSSALEDLPAAPD